MSYSFLYKHTDNFTHGLLFLHFHPFISAPHNLFLEWKLQNKPQQSVRKQANNTTNSICLFPVFCFTSATGVRYVLASAEIKDGENVQMSVDTCACLHCCLWLAHARNETVFWTQWDNQRPRRSIKRKKRSKRAAGKAQTSTLGKFKWLKPPLSCSSLCAVSHYWTSSFSIIAPIGRTAIWPILSHSAEKLRHSSSDPDLSQALSCDWQPIRGSLIGWISECGSQPN